MEATGTQRLSPTVSSQPVVLQCAVCSDHATFKTRMELGRHLRERHCAKEGGSFVCRYGANGVCPTLPLEGVSDKDYVDHVVKEHLSRDDKGKADLEQVPKIFMQPNFALENPATFNTVLPWSQFEPPKDKEQGRQSSKLLQEKLSHYLDIVEVQIARQISYRSEAFFSAMASHDELQDNMTHCLSAIKQLSNLRERTKPNKAGLLCYNRSSLSVL
uniref:Vacuolar protein sorting-associated protein 54 N-terminal domain-containing protein n=1 Tax=Branchiostoma floridae TaxID=7739 RepID=C3ZQC9_BRAFL|eukprot:XP_002589174.1 hypothetical protein BRAFLDRAFT_84932 [Branchiostoma floridae]